MEAEAPALLAAKEAGQELTDVQAKDLTYYENKLSGLQANSVKAEKAIEKMTKSYASAAATVAPRNWFNQTSGFFEIDLWECLGMMLLGMALFKSGALNLGWSTRAYLTMLVAGYGIGLTVNAFEINYIISHDFAPAAVLVPWGVTYDLGRIPTTLGHIALAMLLVRSGWFRGVLGAFSAAGQMALTNYLSQSLICMYLFTGAGLGWFGQLQRFELYYVVASIWVVQLVWSPWWLARFQYGPMEWLWRSLTRWQWQPMRKPAGMRSRSGRLLSGGSRRPRPIGARGPAAAALALLPCPAANHATRSCCGRLAVLERQLPVHRDMEHSGGVLVRLIEGRVILDQLGIEDDDVGDVSLASGVRGSSSERSSAGNAESRRIASAG